MEKELEMNMKNFVLTFDLLEAIRKDICNSITCNDCPFSPVNNSDICNKHTTLHDAMEDFKKKGE